MKTKHKNAHTFNKVLPAAAVILMTLLCNVLYKYMSAAGHLNSQNLSSAQGKLLPAFSLNYSQQIFMLSQL